MGRYFLRGSPIFVNENARKDKRAGPLIRQNLLIKAAFFENIQKPKYREETDNRQNANPSWLHGKPLLIVKRLLIGRVVGRVTPHNAIV